MSKIDVTEKSSPVHISRSASSATGIEILHGAGVWTGFQNLSEAIRFREKTLGIEDSEIIMHEVSDPDDEVVLFGSAMRDLLSKPWRDEQYERMLKGQEFSLTETSLHMSGPSTVIAADILNEAQGDSWSARSGVVRRNQQEEPHIWLRHFSGMILDLAADQFSMSPVVAFHETSDTLWHYEDHGEIDREAVQDLVEIWKDRIYPEQMQNILSKAEQLSMPEPDDMPQI